MVRSGGMKARFLLACCFLLSCRRTAPLPARQASVEPPPPPPAPAAAAASPRRADLTREDRAAWRRRLAWPADCEDEFQATALPAAAGLSIYPLAPGRSLVEVRCAWGAYQGSQMYYLYDETRQPRAEPLSFEVRESPDDRSLVKSETREVAGLPTFDPRSRELSVLDKFRGPGDCGTLATYRFVDGRPRLVKLRAKVACDGRGAEEPERWPEIPPA